MYELDTKTKYDRFLTSAFIWEIVFAATIMGGALVIVNFFELSDANKVSAIIALATVYVGGTLVHGFQSTNAQIHGDSEFLLREISETLTRFSKQR